MQTNVIPNQLIFMYLLHDSSIKNEIDLEVHTILNSNNYLFILSSIFIYLLFFFALFYPV